MKTQLCAVLQRGVRRPAVGMLLVTGGALAAISPQAQGAQASAQFDVMINLLSPEKQVQTGLCDSTRTVDTTTSPTIVCNFTIGRDILATVPSKPGWPYEGRGYRFISYVTGPAGSVDIYTGAGTSTAFRLVNWADREYIEMTVGW